MINNLKYFSCWINGLPFYLTVLTPIGIVIVLNTITFIAVCVSLIKSMNTSKALSEKTKRITNVSGDCSKTQNDKTKRIRSKLSIALFSCFIVLGLTWIFGFLAVNKVKVAFSYLFCICNASQGFLILIAYVLLSKPKREMWKDKVKETVHAIRNKDKNDNDDNGSVIQEVYRPPHMRNDKEIRKSFNPLASKIISSKFKPSVVDIDIRNLNESPASGNTSKSSSPVDKAQTNASRPLVPSRIDSAKIDVLFEPAAQRGPSSKMNIDKNGKEGPLKFFRIFKELSSSRQNSGNPSRVATPSKLSSASCANRRLQISARSNTNTPSKLNSSKNISKHQLSNTTSSTLTTGYNDDIKYSRPKSNESQTSRISSEQSLRTISPSSVSLRSIMPGLIIEEDDEIVTPTPK